MNEKIEYLLDKFESISGKVEFVIMVSFFAFLGFYFFVKGILDNNFIFICCGLIVLIGCTRYVSNGFSCI
jgi:hypothetical protein